MTREENIEYQVMLVNGRDLEYAGSRDTLEEARELAESEPLTLPQHLWETARAAGHCGGLYAPDGEPIDDEPYEWVGDYAITRVAVDHD